MKKQLLGAILSLACVQASAAPEHSIAFVNGQLIFQQYRGMIDKKLDAEFGDSKEKLIAMQKEVAKKVEALKRDEAVLSRAEMNKRKQMVELDQRELQRQSAAYQEDFSLRGNQELQTLGDELQQVVTDIAKEKHYDIVLQRGAAVFVEKSYDITDTVMQKLKALQAKAAPK